VGTRRLGLLSLFVLQGAACIVTADESLWQKRADSRAADHLGARELGGADRATSELPRGDRLGDRGVSDLIRPDQGCGQLLKIAAAGDDGELSLNGPEWLPYGEPGGPGYPPAIYIGAWDGTASWGWFRFTVVKAIPKGTSLKSASVTLPGKAAAWDPAQHALEIWVEDSADPGEVTAVSDAPFTPLTGRDVFGNVRWPASGGLAWSETGANTSPDLTALLQQLVNAHGLAAGSHIQLWLRGAQLADAEVGTPDSSEVGYALSPALLSVCY
jgi:hypothetical protein